MRRTFLMTWFSSDPLSARGLTCIGMPFGHPVCYLLPYGEPPSSEFDSNSVLLSLLPPDTLAPKSYLISFLLILVFQLSFIVLCIRLFTTFSIVEVFLFFVLLIPWDLMHLFLFNFLFGFCLFCLHHSCWLLDFDLGGQLLSFFPPVVEVHNLPRFLF